MENILAVAPEWVQPFFYRTARGAEIDLVLEFAPDLRWATEIKRSLTQPKPSAGFHIGSDDIEAKRRLVVYPGNHSFFTRQQCRDVTLAGIDGRIERNEFDLKNT